MGNIRVTNLEVRPSGFYLTIPCWPDPREPTVRQIVESRITICIDKDAVGFAALSLEPSGILTIMRTNAPPGDEDKDAIL